MPISFSALGANIRVPGVYVEIDGTAAAADLSVQRYKALMLGNRLSTGTVAANEPTLVTSVAQARTYFGRGSMLADMADAWFANNTATELWVLPMDEASGGTASTGQLTVTASSAAAGVIYLYIGGRRLQVSVAASATAAQIATSIVAAIAADLDVAVTAAVNGTDNFKVDLTARHKGTIGDVIDVRLNYYQGEALPSGVGVAITAMSSGAGTPDVATALAALPDEQFHVVAFPFTDTALLTTLDTELEARFAPDVMTPGVAFTAHNGSHSTVKAFGAAQNKRLLSIMATGASPSPTWRWSAAVTAVVARYGAADPARPFQTLPLVGILAPAFTARFTAAERNLLLYDGIATHRVAAGDAVLIERLVTTYQTNGLGADDVAFLDVNILLTLDRLRYDLRTRFALKYPRAKLGQDGKRYGVGQVVVTPSVAKAEVVALFETWLELGLVEAPEQFAADIVAEINVGDPNRLDIQLRPNLINQLRVLGAQIAFLV